MNTFSSYPDRAYTLYMLYMPLFSWALHAAEQVAAPLAEIIRDPAACTHSSVTILASNAIKTLNQKRDLSTVETLQVVHAGCGSILKATDPVRYKVLFGTAPKHVTEAQWRSVLSNTLIEYVIKALRALPTLKSLCATAVKYDQILQKILFHDVLKAVICHLCDAEFLNTNNTSAYNTACTTNLINTINAYLKHYDCDKIGTFGRSLSVLPGYIKLKVAQTCENQFLGVDPLEGDVKHLKAWLAVTGGSENEAFSQRYELLKNDNEKRQTIFNPTLGEIYEYEDS